MKIVGRKEMEETERYVIENIGLPAKVLMELAGNHVAEEIKSIYPDQGTSIVILLGGGNNGGDGFVIARRLFDAGYEPMVWLLAKPEKLKGDAHLQYKVYLARKLPLHHLEDGGERLEEDLEKAEVVIDAILGIGGEGPVREPFKHVIEAVNGKVDGEIIAVDIPSGLSCDTGEATDVAIQANITYTFAFPKRGFFLQQGPSSIGRWHVKDISIPSSIAETVKSNLPEVVTLARAQKALPTRHQFGHKGTFGHVLVAGGSKPYIGAPLHSAESAFMTGAGLVTLLVPEDIYTAVASQNKNALLRTLPSEDGHFISTGMEDLPFEELDVLAVGPGLGRFTGGQEFLQRLMEGLGGQPLVIDADGLYHIKGQLGRVSEYAGEVILTPHPGEMAMLLGKEVSEVEADRLGIAHEFVQKYGVNLILKGHRTVIATPDALLVNQNGNDSLAKGGSGDVLTGIIASFLGQGASPLEAMTAAVHLHATAGESAAIRLSHYSVTPEDVLAESRYIMKEWEVGK
ncbi:NAD(P)H-hydrate dehydratase [Salinicoccus jeotgali]|uniref:Bifunctional NAD(P)H-hydrate repair enzyme n=1 Tax=Salinicoccus jeotgali TaxID=381634 RepID=A0ABP7F0S0_9STAP